jgi:hypothetical protein
MAQNKSCRLVLDRDNDTGRLHSRRRTSDKRPYRSFPSVLICPHGGGKTVAKMNSHCNPEMDQGARLTLKSAEQKSKPEPLKDLVRVTRLSPKAATEGLEKEHTILLSLSDFIRGDDDPTAGLFPIGRTFITSIVIAGGFFLLMSEPQIPNDQVLSV